MLLIQETTSSYMHIIATFTGLHSGGILCRPDDGQDVRSPGRHGRRGVDQEADLERRTMQPAGGGVKDHTSMLGQVCVLPYGVREIAYVVIQHWRLSDQQRLG